MAMSDVGKAGDRGNIRDQGNIVADFELSSVPHKSQPVTSKAIPKGLLASEQSGPLPPAPAHPSPAKPTGAPSTQGAQTSTPTKGVIDFEYISSILDKIEGARAETAEAERAARNDPKALNEARTKMSQLEHELMNAIVIASEFGSRGSLENTFINIAYLPNAEQILAKAEQIEVSIEGAYAGVHWERDIHKAIVDEKAYLAHSYLQGLDRATHNKGKDAVKLDSEQAKAIIKYAANSVMIPGYKQIDQLQRLKDLIATSNKFGVSRDTLVALAERCQHDGLQLPKGPNGLPLTPKEFVDSVLRHP